MWLIMKEFKILPTDERWLALSSQQIDWILYSMERDAEEASRVSRGLEADSEYQDFDNSWFTASHDEFQPVREGDDEDAIARQLNEITTDEDLAKLKARWEASEEVEGIRAQGGTTIEEDSINELIANNLQKALDEAKRIEKHMGTKWKEKSDIEVEEEKAEAQFDTKLKQDALAEAIAVFNGETPDQKATPQLAPDDDFVI